MPIGLTWADLPVVIEPPPGPPVRFTTLTPGICRVSAAGEVDTPGEYDGRPGECRVSAAAPGDDNWEPVEQVLSVELAKPVVSGRIRNAPPTNYTWAGTPIEVAFVVEVLSNPGRAAIVASTQGPCFATNTNSEDRSDVVVTITSPGTCSVFLSGDRTGVFEFTDQFGDPTVINMTDPSATTNTTAP
ncbi:MAG: hypothetical protein AAGA99_19560 [Actinomycetota bacterium]